MKNIINLIIENKEFFVILVSIIGVIIPLYEYLNEKRIAQRNINFERFHEKIMKTLSNNDPKNSVGLDAQVAVIFELRNFPNYYPVSERLLKKQINRWQDKLSEYEHYSWLIEEANETIKYINTSNNFWKRLYKKFKDKYL